MTASWKDLEGVTLAEKFQIQHLLFEWEAGACFLTRIAGGSRASGWLWLALAEDDAESRRAAQWQLAAGLRHPNLAEVWETGRAERGVTSMLYLLTEPADEDLEGVLRERPLNQVEAREAVRGAARALDYLHSRALVHGRLDPAAILAIGEQVKLSSDSIAGSVESGDGERSAADDLREFAGCIHAMFTQNPAVDPERLSAIPQPFRDIIRGCYGANAEDPEERWTAQRIIARLDLPAAPAAPAAPEADRPALEWVPTPPPPADRKRLPGWMFAPIGVGVLLLALLLSRKPQPASAPPAPPPDPSRAAVSASAAPPPARPSAVGPPAHKASPPASAPGQTQMWRVISYTYMKAEDAARMVHEINRRWPHLRAQEFSPNGSAPPYFISLGGRMTRTEAMRMQQRAISSGMPPDTFVRNFRN